MGPHLMDLSGSVTPTPKASLPSHQEMFQVMCHLSAGWAGMGWDVGLDRPNLRVSRNFSSIDEQHVVK